MQTATDFFAQNAGWSYDPARETPEQGRRRSGYELAEAERFAEQVGLRFQWSDDWTVGSHLQEYGEAYAEGEPETCEQALAFDAAGNVVASLSCIDGADAAYRRVVEAELAFEIMPGEGC